MKKLMIAMVAVALATVANAAASYQYTAFGYVSKYNKADQGSSCYHFYAMTQASARDLTGSGSTAVTVNSLSTWLKSQTAAESLVAAKAESVKYDSLVGTTQYGFANMGKPYVDANVGDDALAVVFYSDDAGYMAYKVIAQDTAQSYRRFQMDDTAQSSSGWQTTQVPEPTSGLLLLLGVAGLALKRKQK